MAGSSRSRPEWLAWPDAGQRGGVVGRRDSAEEAEDPSDVASYRAALSEISGTPGSDRSRS